MQWGLTLCLICGCDVPTYNPPVQEDNQLYPLRFSARTYPQHGSFEELCKGALLASHVFVVLMPAHITPVKKKKEKNVFLPVLHPCVTVFVCIY